MWRKGENERQDEVPESTSAAPSERRRTGGASGDKPRTEGSSRIGESSEDYVEGEPRNRLSKCGGRRGPPGWGSGIGLRFNEEGRGALACRQGAVRWSRLGRQRANGLGEKDAGHRRQARPGQRIGAAGSRLPLAKEPDLV